MLQQPGCQHGGCQRFAQQALAELFQHDRHFSEPESEAAVVFGDEDAQPAELRHLA